MIIDDNCAYRSIKIYLNIYINATVLNRDCTMHLLVV